MSRIARTTPNTLFEGIQIINKKIALLCRNYEDQRPYCERRLDAALCEQDVKQGFKERRNRPYVNFIMMFPAGCIAPALPTFEEEWDIENQIIRKEDCKEKKECEKECEKELTTVAKKMAMNPVMVIKMKHLFRCEITDEIYQNNVQFIRDQMNIHYEEENVDKIDYNVVAAPVKRNRRRVLLDIV